MRESQNFNNEDEILLMNIFKSLSQGNGKISETNVTSFLSSLLNSTNELDNSLLMLFFELIDKELTKNKLTDLLDLKQADLRQRIFHFSKKFSVIANPEYAVKKSGKGQVIDVLITISNKKDETDVAFILIENKIKTWSVNEFQVSKQFECFTASEEYKREKLPVYSIVLTPDYDSFSKMHSNAVKSNPNSIWIKWTNGNEKEDSLEGIFRRLLIYEQQAEIQPINPNSQFILKSFIDYIATEFSNVSANGRNFSYNGSDEVEKANVYLRGREYILRRYENKMIRLFDRDDEEVKIAVRPFLVEVNQLYGLNIDTNHSTKTAKNTQVLGREVISALTRQEQSKMLVAGAFLNQGIP